MSFGALCTQDKDRFKTEIYHYLRYSIRVKWPEAGCLQIRSRNHRNKTLRESLIAASRILIPKVALRWPELLIWWIKAEKPLYMF